MYRNQGRSADESLWWTSGSQETAQEGSKAADQKEEKTLSLRSLSSEIAS